MGPLLILLPEGRSATIPDSPSTLWVGFSCATPHAQDAANNSSDSSHRILSCLTLIAVVA